MMLTGQIVEFHPFLNCWQADRKIYTLTLAWQTYTIISANYHIHIILERQYQP